MITADAGMQRIGVLPLCRPTFDVEYAGSRLELALGALRQCGYRVVGEPCLLTDNATAADALGRLTKEGVDRILVVQTTFTDAECIVDIAGILQVPLAIWALREPRSGARLRLNSFCGLNLASHALGLRGHEFTWLCSDPEQATDDDIRTLFEPASAGRQCRMPDRPADSRAAGIAAGLRGARIGQIGLPPPGFDTCNHDNRDLDRLAGIEVVPVRMESLFDTAHKIGRDRLDAVRQEVDADLSGIEAVDPAPLERSLRLSPALSDMASSEGLDAMAVRCWPEMFTEYGGAVCGPVSMMGQSGMPCACEADVHGALSQLVLQRVAQAPVFLADMVDMDPDDDSAVVWHCGQAPVSMRDPGAPCVAAVHSNRKLPLLYEFPLKPGEVTLMRISRSMGTYKMVLLGGRMLRRPLAFSGTAGVIRFERPAGKVMQDVINCGLEHHLAIAYGDHRHELRGIAAALGLPILDL